MASKLYVEADWASGQTSPLPLNHKQSTLALQVAVTGTVTFDIQSTNSDLQAGESASWLVDSSNSTGITASKWITFNAVPRFIRINVTAGGSGATIKLLWSQDVG